MTDYIKRSDVLEFSRIFNDQLWETGGYRNYPTEAVPVSAIRNIPSADVQPVVHGEWVDGGVDGVGACGIEYRYNKCSVCGYEYSFPMKYNFCPRCGARMDGGT